MFQTKTGAAGLSIVSNATPDRAQARRRRDHRLDRDHHRGDPLGDRPARLGGRLFSVRAADEPADREHPYGHEKVENLAAAIEGMLILVGAGIIIFEATRRLVDGSEVEDLGVGIAVIGFSAVANLSSRRSCTAARGRSTRRRWRATPPTCAPTRSPRSASSSACCWSRSPASRPSTRSPRSRRRGHRRRRGSDPDPLGPGAGRRVAAGRRARPVEEAIAAAPRAPEIAGYHKLRARGAGSRRYIDLHLQFRPGTTLEDAHASPTPPREAIEAEIPRSEVLIHPEPEESLRPARGAGAGPLPGGLAPIQRG